MSRSRLPTFDHLILGAGAGGSLLARVLSQRGYAVALVERQVFPRFAIGESSTPLADLLLRELARREQLADVFPLATWGSWRASYPDVRCGLKRGFSYFSHDPARPVGGRRMLVTASPNIELADTHWMRSDTDRLLLEFARRAGTTVYQPWQVESIEREARWRVQISDAQSGARRTLAADTIIDASGTGRVLGRALSIPEITDRLKTRTQVSFGHFVDLPSWSERFRDEDPTAPHYPFDPDDAAQHHLLQDGWLWVLRFVDGVSSVGWCRPVAGGAGNEGPTSERAADLLGLKPHPELCRWFSPARCITPRCFLQAGRRPQFWAGRVCGDGWYLMPGTAVTIDALHSTGLAQTMLGVTRLVAALEGELGSADYARLLHTETKQLDRMIAVCYAALDDFELFTAATMPYFVAAIDSEERLQRHGLEAALQPQWLSDNATFASLLQQLNRRIKTGRRRNSRNRESTIETVGWLREAIAPWNDVGLLDPKADHLYRYTAATKSDQNL